jgi:hypothetical protein
MRALNCFACTVDLQSYESYCSVYLVTPEARAMLSSRPADKSFIRVQWRPGELRSLREPEQLLSASEILMGWASRGKWMAVWLG